MPSVIKKNILWLQVAINNIESVKTFQRTQQLCSVEASSIDIKSLFFLEMMEQLSSIDKRKNQIKFLGRLEGEFEWNDEGVIDLRKNRSLSQSVSHFRAGDDMCFADCFESVDTMSIFLPTYELVCVSSKK
jgi:hypothetical protein